MVRECIRTIVVETPQNIYDTQTAEYESGTTVPRDVFYEITSSFVGSGIMTEGQVETFIHILWRMYGLRMISSCDVDWWIRCCTDRFFAHSHDISSMVTIDDTMRLKFNDDSIESVHSEFTSEDLPDSATGSTAFINNRTANDTTRKAGLNTETAKQMIATLPNGYRTAAMLIDDFFLPVM